MIRSPKVDYGLFRAYALPQSCTTFAIRGAPSPTSCSCRACPKYHSSHSSKLGVRMILLAL